MSIIPKIWSLCNCRNIISTIASNINGNLKCGNIIFQRLLSKRFTIGRDCKKPKSKKAHCEGELGKKRKDDENKQCPECITEDLPKKSQKPPVIDVCTPFRKKTNKKKCDKKKPRCSAGMKGSCEGKDCVPSCTLTKGKGERSCNECPKDVGSALSQNCPKGNWNRGED